MKPGLVTTPDPVRNAYDQFNEAARGIEPEQRARIFDAMLDTIELAKQGAFLRGFGVGVTLTLAVITLVAFMGAR